MRISLGLFWAIVLFVCTCTTDILTLIKDGSFRFFFNSRPRWEDLLIVSDINLHSKLYVIQKIGHFSGFFILAVILTNLGRRNSGIYLSICYAVATEILQLFFYRDGRIVDMFIDTSGIILAYWLCYIYQRHKRNGFDIRQNL